MEKQLYFGIIREKMRAAPGSYQMGILHLYLGMEESAHGNFAEAKRIFEETMQLFIGFGNMNLVMRSEIGHLERNSGNLSEARVIYRETIWGWQVLGNRSAVANQLECFGILAIADAESRRAASLFGVAERCAKTAGFR